MRGSRCFGIGYRGTSRRYLYCRRPESACQISASDIHIKNSGSTGAVLYIPTDPGIYGLMWTLLITSLPNSCRRAVSTLVAIVCPSCTPDVGFCTFMCTSIMARRPLRRVRRWWKARTPSVRYYLFGSFNLLRPTATCRVASSMAGRQICMADTAMNTEMSTDATGSRICHLSPRK